MRFRGPQALRDTYRKQGVEGSLPNLERPAQVSHEDSPSYSSSFFSHPCALFCIHQKLNSLVFMWFRTLCPKPPGWGEVLSPESGCPNEFCLRRAHCSTKMHPISSRWRFPCDEKYGSSAYWFSSESAPLPPSRSESTFRS